MLCRFIRLPAISLRMILFRVFPLRIVAFRPPLPAASLLSSYFEPAVNLKPRDRRRLLDYYGFPETDSKIAIRGGKRQELIRFVLFFRITSSF